MTAPPPDRQRPRGARWLVLLPPATIYFVSVFHRIAPAVVAGDLMRAFEITAAALGTLAALYPYVFVAMAFVAGTLADTLGPRWTLALGATTMGAGAIVFGLAPTFSVASAGRLLVGLGASVILIASLSLAARWFRPDEFATVSGCFQTVGNLGGLVAATPLALMVEGVGWRGSFVTIGGLTLVLGAAAFLAVRDRPEAMGLAPVNPAPVGRAAPTLSEVLRGIPEVVRNVRTWPPVLAASGTYSTLIAVQGLWGVPYLVQAYGLGRVEAANAVAFIPVGIVVGAPIAGWISDRWLVARRAPFIAFTLVFAACWIPLVVPAARLPAALLAPYFLLMGLASSGHVLLWSCVREVNNPERLGVVIGFCNIPVFLAFALMQWLTGAILDAWWTGEVRDGLRVYSPEAWHAAFGACLGVALLAVAMVWLVTETRCRNVWRAAPQDARGD